MNKRKHDKENVSPSEEEKKQTKKTRKTEEEEIIFIEDDDDEDEDEEDDEDEDDDQEDDDNDNYDNEDDEYEDADEGNEESIKTDSIKTEDEIIVLGDNESDFIKQLKIFQSLIRTVRSSGKTAISGEAIELPPHPGIYIDNFGVISTPLNGILAESLIKICKQAPYGQNQETLIDTEVRDSYQIEPNHVKIKNSAWNNGLNKLLERIAEGLGCHTKISANLYKLLIYRPGGHFKKHKDTEKEKNMFGTLIIQLPSDHEGGELVIYNNDNTTSVHDFGVKKGTAPYSIQFAAHFADVEHEIKEVKKSYRVALIYSLCWVSNGNGNDKSINNRDKVSVMEHCLDNLNSSAECKLAFLLDHEYTHNSLHENGIKALKGIDNDRFNLIKNANQRLPADKQFSFYIANVNLVVEYGAMREDVGGEDSYEESNNGSEDSDWEETDATKSIEKWYNFNGVSKNATVEFDYFTKIIIPNEKKDIFTEMDEKNLWGKTKKIQQEGYSGNEGCSRTTTYNKYLLALWPKKQDSGVFLEMNQTVTINYLYNNLSDALNDKDINKKLERLVKNLLKPNKGIISEKSLVKLSTVFETITNDEQVKKILQNFTMPIESLAKLIIVYGWDALSSSLTVILRPELDNLLKLCDLVQKIIILEKTEISYHVFKSSVLRMLHSVVSHPLTDRHKLVYFRLVETTLLLKNIEPEILQKLDFIFEIFGRNQNYIDDKSIEKLLILAENRNDLNILKVLVKNLKLHSKSIIGLISTYSWEVFQDSLMNKSLQPKFENILNSCDLIKVFSVEFFFSILKEFIFLKEMFTIEMNALQVNQVSYQIFKLSILPILSDKNSFESVKNENKLCYFKLAETILLFKKNADKEIEEKFDFIFELLGKNQRYIQNELIETLLTTTESQKDLDFTKLFLKYVKLQVPALVRLLSTYDWDLLKESLLDESIKPSFKNIEKNCELIKEIHNLKKPEISFQIFESSVMPVIINSDEFNHHNHGNTLAYFESAETLLLFKGINLEIDSKFDSVFELIGRNQIEIGNHLIEKLLGLVENKNDLSFLKSFLRHVKLQAPVLVQLITKYNWNELQESLLNKSLQPLFENIPNSCELIKVICEQLDEETSYSILKASILPILDKSEKNFRRELFQEECKLKLPLYFKLIETVWIFKDRGIEEYLEKYKDICLKYMDHKVLKELLEMLLNVKNIYRSTGIIKLYQLYCQHMANKLSKPPGFSWFMHGTIPGHPSLNSFLRSNEYKIMYRGQFRSIRDARDFAYSYGRQADGFSLNIVANGIGVNAHVDITKTKQYFLQQTNIYQESLRNFNLFVQKMNSLVYL